MNGVTGKPNSRSLSVCLKNSSLIRLAHKKDTLYGLRVRNREQGKENNMGKPFHSFVQKKKKKNPTYF
jgi:hypothetical protein